MAEVKEQQSQPMKESNYGRDIQMHLHVTVCLLGL